MKHTQEHKIFWDRKQVWRNLKGKIIKIFSVYNNIELEIIKIEKFKII